MVLNVGMNRCSYEISVSRADRAMHELEYNICFADRDAVKVSPELARCILLKFSD